MKFPNTNPMENNQEKLAVSTRIAGPEDSQILKELRLEALGGEDQKMFTGEHPEWTEKERNMTDEDWKKELSDKNNFLVLTSSGVKPIGSAGVWKSSEEPDLYLMGRSYVKKEFRGENIGKKQFAFRINEIIKRGGTKIAHGVWHENQRMINLSESFGFKKTTEEPIHDGFYYMELNDLTKPELLAKINEALKA